MVGLATAASAESVFVYFGTYTNALSRGIYVSRLDSATGKLSAPELAAAIPNPNFVNLSPNGKYLYSANSAAQPKGNGVVSAFAIDKTSGRLTLLNQKEAGAADPCHVSVDATGQTLLVANYDNGSLKSIPIRADGSLGDGGAYFLTVGRSANPNRQAGPHAHFATVDSANRFVLMCNLGTDQVMVYHLNNADSTLAATDSLFAAVPPGSGPRHLAFSRDGKFVHVINEMACTISTFAWDAGKGKLDLIETVSALPPGVAVQNTFTGAEILVSGKFVYATLRGHDSVSVFATDERSGRLTFAQNVSAGGKVPRGLGIDPTGRWLIVANQKSDNAVVFAIDAARGKLSPTGRELKIGSPVDVKFVR